jgi:hypothetical protein
LAATGGVSGAARREEQRSIGAEEQRRAEGKGESGVDVPLDEEWSERTATETERGATARRRANILERCGIIRGLMINNKVALSSCPTRTKSVLDFDLFRNSGKVGKTCHARAA